MLNRPTIRAALSARAVRYEIDCSVKGWRLLAVDRTGEIFPIFESRDQAIAEETLRCLRNEQAERLNLAMGTSS
jgi:hypothetical protein